jgi:hypothetical protein
MATNKTATAESPTPKAAASSRAIVIVNPTFKWAVIINCVICISTLMIMLAVAITSQKENKLAEQLFSTCEKVFTLTAGAFIGLLGGKASGPDKR